jgi:hypothetical protein
MKTILIVVAAAAALTTALPAAAQPRWDRDQRWDRDTRRDWVQARRIDEREMRIEQRIRNGQRRRLLSPGEARNFRIKLNQTEQIERRYKRSGRDLTRKEVGILNYRLDNLEREIRMKVRD